MPRDGSNIYSKPTGTTAVAGTTIEAAKFNSVVDDLVTDANAARPIVAGGTGATSASAARTALGLGSAISGTAGTDGNLVSWDGSGEAADSGLSPSGSDANVITGTAGTDGYVPTWNADGDIVDGYEVPDDNDFANSPAGLARRDNVQALISASTSRELLEPETVISSAVVDYTTPDISGHNTVVIEFDNLKPDTDDGDLRARTSPDGSSFDSAATAYAYALTNARGGASITQDADTGASFIFVTGGVGNAAGDSGASGRIIVHNADAALPTQMEINSVFENTNNDIRAQNGGAHRKASAAVLKLRLYFNNGDILSGNIRVYGVK